MLPWGREELDCLRIQTISISSNDSVSFSNMCNFVAIKITKISQELFLPNLGLGFHNRSRADPDVGTPKILEVLRPGKIQCQ